mmetsp:Transcript_8688/g.23916  ORF Transcript_8688/g.23916 Transcript_8688/m.23916 type:complete len:228 (-) Transcript_8688:473-1156(-)
MRHTCADAMKKKMGQRSSDGGLMNSATAGWGSASESEARTACASRCTAASSGIAGRDAMRALSCTWVNPSVRSSSASPRIAASAVRLMPRWMLSLVRLMPRWMPSLVRLISPDAATVMFGSAPPTAARTARARSTRLPNLPVGAPLASTGGVSEKGCADRGSRIHVKMLTLCRVGSAGSTAAARRSTVRYVMELARTALELSAPVASAKTRSSAAGDKGAWAANRLA